MAEDIIKTAIEFLEKIREAPEVTIKFKKKDGTTRVMNCTLNFDKIPRGDRPKSVNLAKILKLLNDKKIVHVYDLEKNQWRSVNFDSAEWIEVIDKTKTKGVDRLRRFKIKK